MLHPPRAHLQFVPSCMHGQPCDKIPPQLNRVNMAPRLVRNKEVPARRVFLYKLPNLKPLPMLTIELPISSGWLTLPVVTSLPRPTCEARISLSRPTHRVWLVPKLMAVRRQLSWEKPLTRQCLLMTCRCLSDSDMVQWKPPKWTLRRTQPQHLVARSVTKLLTVTWAPAVFRCLSLPNRPQAASTPKLLKTA